MVEQMSVYFDVELVFVAIYFRLVVRFDATALVSKTIVAERDGVCETK